MWSCMIYIGSLAAEAFVVAPRLGRMCFQHEAVQSLLVLGLVLLLLQQQQQCNMLAVAMHVGWSNT